MKSYLYVQNLRCGGCATSIIKALTIIKGIKGVNVFPEEDKVTFMAKDDDARLKAIRTIKKMGYPSKIDDNSISDRMKSIMSCVKGKI